MRGPFDGLTTQLFNPYGYARGVRQDASNSLSNGLVFRTLFNAHDDGRLRDIVGGTIREQTRTDLSLGISTDVEVGEFLNMPNASDVIEIYNDPALSVSRFSISMWVKRTAALGTVEAVISKGRTGADHPYGIWHLNSFLGYNGFAVVSFDGAYHIADQGSVATTNQWYHIVGVHDGSNHKMYIDGVLTRTTAYAGPLVNNSRTLVLGAQYWTSLQHPFVGGMKDLRFYNRALSASEVWAIKTDGKRDLVPNTPFMPVFVPPVVGGVNLINGGLVNNGLVNAGLVR